MKAISNLFDIFSKNLELKEFVGNKVENKDKILHFLKNKEVYATATSYLYDKLGNKNTTIPLISYTDGNYVWDTEDIYYFEQYDLKLNDDFIEYVLKHS